MLRKHVHMDDVITRECFKRQFQWARETLHQTWRVQKHQDKYERTISETQVTALCFGSCTDFFQWDKKSVQDLYHECGIDRNYDLSSTRHDY